MLFNSVLASITIYCVFSFYFLLFLKTFYKSWSNWKRKTTNYPIIPAGALITVANDAIEIPPANIGKTFNDLSKKSKEAIYLLVFLLISSLSLISAKKYYLMLLILFNLNCCSFDIFAFRFG